MACSDLDAAFSVEVLHAGGKPLKVDGLTASETLSAFTVRLCEALSIPPAQAGTRLGLLVGERIVSLDCTSQTLADAGFGPGIVVTVILKAEPQIFEWTIEQDHTDNDNIGTIKSRLLLAGSCCFLVSKEYDPDDGTHLTDYLLQWDILHGNAFKFDGGVATCSWDVHLRRVQKYRKEREETKDSGWEIMDERASVRWKRIQAIERVDSRSLEGKLASLSEEELREAVQEGLRSKGIEQSEIDEWLGTVDDGHDEDCIGGRLLENNLRQSLLDLYKGQGLNLGLGMPVDICNALAPGRLLGSSASWCRLQESDERQALEIGVEPAGAALGIDLGRSCLLGIELHDVTGKALDLSDLPQLLGLEDASDPKKDAARTPEPQSKQTAEKATSEKAATRKLTTGAGYPEKAATAKAVAEKSTRETVGAEVFDATIEDTAADKAL